MADILLADVVNTSSNTTHFGIFFIKESGEAYVVTVDSAGDNIYIGWANLIVKAQIVGRDDTTGIMLIKAKTNFKDIDRGLLQYGLTDKIGTGPMYAWAMVYGLRVYVRAEYENLGNGTPFYNPGINKMTGMYINGVNRSYNDVCAAVGRIRRFCVQPTIGASLQPFGLFYSALYSGGMVENSGLVVTDIAPFGPLQSADVPLGSIITAPVKNGAIDYGDLRPGDSMTITFYGGTVKEITLEPDTRSSPFEQKSCWLSIYMKTLKTGAELKK